MKKLFQVKFILFIFLSFFVFDIKISSAQWIDQPCSNFAGAVCVLNPSVFQYEIMQHSVCPDKSQRCVKRRSNCTKQCKKSYDCMGGPISGFCEGVDMVCCGGNMTSQQYASMDKALKKESLCPAGEIYLEVPILATTKCVKDLSDYIRILYNFGIYAASVMAVIMISINGFKWVAAGGNQSTIGKAKSGVFTAIIGLFLLFGSYMILNTVNSKLTLLKMPNVEPIKTDTLDIVSPSFDCTMDGGLLTDDAAKCSSCTFMIPYTLKEVVKVSDNEWCCTCRNPGSNESACPAGYRIPPDKYFGSCDNYCAEEEGRDGGGIKKDIFCCACRGGAGGSF